MRRARTQRALFFNFLAFLPFLPFRSFLAQLLDRLQLGRQGRQLGFDARDLLLLAAGAERLFSQALRLEHFRFVEVGRTNCRIRKNVDVVGLHFEEAALHVDHLFFRLALETKVTAEENSFAAEDLMNDVCWLSTHVEPIERT